jgi:cytochrome b pre-mRNA-processing protein 3
MLSNLFRRAPSADSIASLYGTIVAQARRPAFYQLYGVPDTVNGRLEMIMLHTVLLLRRLEREPEAVRLLGQGVFDRFCRDMDDSLREIGIGDLALPRSMQRIGEAFYGRQAAYKAALAAANDVPLAAAVARNIFAEASSPQGPIRLAAYIRAAERALAAQHDFTRALAFPDPEQPLPAAAWLKGKP